VIPFPAVVHRNQLYTAELADLLEAMQTGRSPRVSLQDGVETLQIVAAARRAAASGRSVTLEAQ
jgi:predicted dehydrogenase